MIKPTESGHIYRLTLTELNRVQPETVKIPLERLEWHLVYSAVAFFVVTNQTGQFVHTCRSPNCFPTLPKGNERRTTCWGNSISRVEVAVSLTSWAYPVTLERVGRKIVVH
jgi:hypothetical protein